MGAAPAQAGGGGGALIYALAHDATTLDPSEATDIESGTVMQQIYEGLLTFGPSDTKLYPALAQSYEISDNGTMWTFHLRHGVKFHDGTPFDAEAVRFSFERMIDENHPYHLPGRMTYAPTVLGNFVKKIDTPDTHTVIITLNAPYTPFGHNLAMVPASIVSPTAMKKAGRDNFGNEPCGTGPFRLARWRRDNEILLERNPDYWGEPTASQRVYFKIIPDGNVRYSSLVRGDVHIIVGVEIAYMDKLRADPKFNLFEQPGFNTGYIILNNSKPPLNDVRVRRALNYAVNKDYIVNTVFRGTSVVAHGVLPPGMLGFNPNLEGYGYDPGKARELLKEAGYPNGFSITMSTTVTPRPYNPAGIKLAEVVQGHLRDVGVEVNLRQLDFGTLLDALQASEYEIANTGWVSDNGDPDNFIYLLLGDLKNYTYYRNDHVNELLAKAQQVQDDERRRELYFEAEKLVVADAPWIFINHAKQVVAASKRVRDFVPHPTAVPYLHHSYVSTQP